MKRFIACAILCAIPRVLYAEDQRVAVVIGSDLGDEDDRPLAYAEADAQRFHRLLVDAGGVKEERAYLAIGATADEARATLYEAVGRVRELERNGPTTFIVYASAHADEDALHLGVTRLPISELTSIMARSGARLRIAIVDGCRTAASTRNKGGAPENDRPRVIEAKSALEGEVLVRSSSFGEPAQEWDYLRGSLFSHHLVAGLRGLADIDGDHRVSLAEAYTYAYRKTAIDAVTAGAGAQHPSFVFGISGHGEWTFTEPSRFGAAIIVGKDIEGTISVADRKRELVAEVTKRTGETAYIAVPRGWYRVVRREGRFAHVADVNLGFGGERTVDAASFVRTLAENVRLRGREPFVLRPWRVGLGYAIGGGAISGVDVQHAAVASLERELSDDWLFRSRVEISRANVRAPSSAIRHDELVFAVAGGYAVRYPWITVVVGGEAGAVIAHQTIHRDGVVDQIYGSVPDKWASQPMLGAFVDLRLAVGEQLGLELELGGRARRVVDLSDRERVTLDPRLMIGASWSP